MNYRVDNARVLCVKCHLRNLKLACIEVNETLILTFVIDLFTDFGDTNLDSGEQTYNYHIRIRILLLYSSSWHFFLSFFRHIVKTEGPKALFKGLVPNIVGVAPSRAIYFGAYAQSKTFFNTVLNPDTPIVHVLSASFAGKNYFCVWCGVFKMRSKRRKFDSINCVVQHRIVSFIRFIANVEQTIITFNENEINMSIH